MTIENSTTAGATAASPIDAIVVGAGFSGINMVRLLRDRGFDVLGIEAGDGVGGTWYWNRYPGARTDSEAFYYCYSFDQELLKSWKWSERYPAQPEVRAYLEHAADRFDVRRLFRFGVRVLGSRWDESTSTWAVQLDTSEIVYTRFLVSAMGILSAPNAPEIPGVETFEGRRVFAQQWPDDVDLTGKRVGIIGTGATGIQLTPVAAKLAAELFVLQRTPHYIIPNRNRPMTDEWRSQIHEQYDQIWEKVRSHPFAMPFTSRGLMGADATEESLETIFEEGWANGGLAFLFETFDDLLTNPEVNAVASEFFRKKIREVVHDPETAEKLTPRDYPLGAKRLPGEHSYYEAFNRPNVHVVDIRSTPIVEFTPKGLRLQDGTELELDIVVFATGFDAFSGAVSRVDIRGRSGVSIAEKWADGPATYLGIAVHDFPNFFMIGGPQSPFANNPPLGEAEGEYIARAVEFARDKGLSAIEPDLQREQEWDQLVQSMTEGTVFPQGEAVNSWIVGANIPGKKRVVQVYFGGAADYVNRLNESADTGFPDYVVSEIVRN